MRRPLCGAALILFLLFLALPPSLWMRTEIREGAESFVGVVGKRERRDGMQVYYLKDTSISEARWILVYLKESDSQYFIGNTLKVYGTITTYEKAGNPGQFDSRVYYQTRKIDAVCFARKMEVLDDTIDLLGERLFRLRTKLGNVLELHLNEEHAGIMKAMLLGERHALPAEVKELYQDTGISHLLSISGLHISILGMGLYRCLRKAGLSFVAAGIPAVILMNSYGIMIGAGASTLRALCMFFLAIGADLAGRTYDTRTGLAVAAIGLLLSQPLYAFDGGFLLSFGAVLGLTEVSPLLAWLLAGKQYEAKKAWKKLYDGIATCLGIQIMTLPILMKYFYEVPSYSIVLNLLVVPCMPALLILGLVCMLGRFRPAAWGCAGILWLVERVAEAGSRLPMNSLTTGAPERWQMSLYYLGLGGLLLYGWLRREREREEQEAGTKTKRKERIIFGSVYGICLVLLFARFRPEFTMTMLDVGQGDGIYIQTRGGCTFLIDGGSTSEDGIGQYILEPYLKYKGEEKLDYILVSHGDEDHISGVREILVGDLLEVGCLILPASGKDEENCEELEKLAKEQGVTVRWMAAGDSIQDQKLFLRCLGPETGVTYESENAGSLVLSLEYEKLRILLTGDLEGSGEALVMEKLQGESLEVGTYDILKVAHHGSAYSTGEKFLSLVRPSVCLISCGRENAYGHPHEELLERLEKAGCGVYRTDLCGALTVVSNGKKYKIQPHF